MAGGILKPNYVTKVLCWMSDLTSILIASRGRNSELNIGVTFQKANTDFGIIVEKSGSKERF